MHKKINEIEKQKNTNIQIHSQQQMLEIHTNTPLV